MKAKNILKCWKTSVVGVVLITAAIISVFKNPNITWTDASAVITIGIALLFSSDNTIDKLLKFKSNNEVGV